ncbi:hypothetical protein SAMN05443287_108204 [Micromonospora phaseoli]|uniref:Uncharacterized protein n=1 Tax=Micromonospora phaseoli TaxID=1144548 RepID=A0A1H7C2D1_9ACTN|nr:hypothetical protein [Micromonospora phaseoli]PZV92657.1 hypothetical protein CLV64_11080 [Micromonospora phaseoli]GIJ76689.1 hypothetical protein Xph01_11210 [Micromonospora phaseoli]SEJ83798.1 hypothetical protein SAMN05443287_108204 [Micromonospora phaseoli]
MKTRTGLVIGGCLLMAYAVVGATTDADLAPAGVLLFLAAVLVGHDAVWMVAVLAVGAALTRVPPRCRTTVRIAAITAAAVTVVGLPLALGFGRAADNASVLPLPYGRNLLAVLLVIAGTTLLACVSPLRRPRAADRKESERPGGGSP